MSRPRVDLRKFREELNEPVGEFAEIATLPEHQRKEMCEKLLEEFGVTQVSPQGAELVHSCPLPGNAHRNGDRNPSARLNYQKLTFICWSCGRSGGLLWFIATCRESDTTEARKWLERETGTGGQEMSWSAVLAAIEHAWARGAAPEPMPRYGERVLDEWTWPRPYPMLTAHPDTPVPKHLMAGRGIPAETCRAFKVGYAPDYRMRTEEGVVTQERIIIPHFWDGNLVGWQARAIDKRDKPKYKNSPGLPKDRTLYNYAKRRRAVLVESPMSVLRHHHHVPEMEATFGATVTDRQVRLLRSCDEVVVWFDNDEGGFTGTRKLIEGLSDHTDLLVVASPFAGGPDDVDDDTVARLIRRAKPWPLWSPPSETRPWKGAA